MEIQEIPSSLEAVAAVQGAALLIRLRGVATYRDVYKLTYVRGPSGIIVMLAEELKRADRGSIGVR